MAVKRVRAKSGDNIWTIAKRLGITNAREVAALQRKIGTPRAGVRYRVNLRRIKEQGRTGGLAFFAGQGISSTGVEGGPNLALNREGSIVTEGATQGLGTEQVMGLDVPLGTSAALTQSQQSASNLLAGGGDLLTSKFGTQLTGSQATQAQVQASSSQAASNLATASDIQGLTGQQQVDLIGKLQSQNQSISLPTTENARLGALQGFKPTELPKIGFAPTEKNVLGATQGFKPTPKPEFAPTTTNILGAAQGFNPIPVGTPPTLPPTPQEKLTPQDQRVRDLYRNEQVERRNVVQTEATTKRILDAAETGDRSLLPVTLTNRVALDLAPIWRDQYDSIQEWMAVMGYEETAEGVWNKLENSVYEAGGQDMSMSTNPLLTTGGGSRRRSGSGNYYSGGTSQGGYSYAPGLVSWRIKL